MEANPPTAEINSHHGWPGFGDHRYDANYNKSRSEVYVDECCATSGKLSRG
jgi:hypothetical protein